MGLVWFLLIGLAAGWLAGHLVKGRGFGLLENLVIGVIGAVIGGYVFGSLGVSTGGLLGQLIAATVGALILLVLLKLIRRGKPRTRAGVFVFTLENSLMLRVRIAAAVGLVLASASTDARAQYGYPGGYGGYGWGGWGSTVQGSIARGLGYFNMGRGMNNLNTAQAASINTDTVQRWNQYVFQSQQEANQRYAAHLRGEAKRINEAQANIHDRLRNHPETLDITDGDALNEILVTLLNPGVSSSGLRSITTPVRPELIQDIPFEVASEGMTICLSEMTQKENWPLALNVDAFASERAAVSSTIATALKEDEAGTIKPKTIEAVEDAIEKLHRKFVELVPKNNPDYVPAKERLSAMAGITKMLYSPKIEEILAELEDYQGTTLGELLTFMQAFNLRFAPANSFRQRRIYLKLYPMLAAIANGLAAGFTPVVRIAQAGENAGKTIYADLASAADRLFQDMDWKHLRPRAPSPPPPAQP